MISSSGVASLMSSASQSGFAEAGGALSAVIASGKTGTMDPAQADKASKDFESMFLSQMMEQMFGDSSGDDAFGNSDTSDVYKGLMMEQYGKMIERAGGIGIASYVKRELLKHQEVGATGAQAQQESV